MVMGRPYDELVSQNFSLGPPQIPIKHPSTIRQPDGIQTDFLKANQEIMQNEAESSDSKSDALAGIFMRQGGMFSHEPKSTKRPKKKRTEDLRRRELSGLKTSKIPTLKSHRTQEQEVKSDVQKKGTFRRIKDWTKGKFRKMTSEEEPEERSMSDTPGKNLSFSKAEQTETVPSHTR